MLRRRLLRMSILLWGIDPMAGRPTYAATKKAFAKFLDGIVFTNKSLAVRAAKAGLSHKQSYVDAEKESGVPAAWLMGIHFREADYNQRCCLANGDPIIGTGRLTTHVPAGLGPYRTFADSVKDGVRYERFVNPKWNELAYWAYAAQCWHGWGSSGMDSYVWRATSREQAGMWVADHVFDRAAVDPRSGVVALWMALFELDPNLKPKDPAPSVPLVAPPVGTVVVAGLTGNKSYIMGASLMTLLYIVRWYIKHGGKDVNAIFANPVTSLMGFFAILAGVGTVGGQIVSGHPVDATVLGTLINSLLSGIIGLAAADSAKK